MNLIYECIKTSAQRGKLKKSDYSDNELIKKSGKGLNMYAYAECYLDDAMRNLGEAVEYAVCRCSLLPDRFMEMFIAGGLADGFEKGSMSRVPRI